MSASRAEKRRALKARTKATDYAESGFKDRAKYQQPTPQTRDGSRHNGGYTADELHQRAVALRDDRKAIETLIAEQARATKESDRDRRLAANALRRSIYLAACAKPQPVRYMHSAARRRLGVAPVAMAA